MIDFKCIYLEIKFPHNTFLLTVMSVADVLLWLQKTFKLSTYIIFINL